MALKSPQRNTTIWANPPKDTNQLPCPDAACCTSTRPIRPYSVRSAGERPVKGTEHLSMLLDLSFASADCSIHNRSNNGPGTRQGCHENLQLIGLFESSKAVDPDGRTGAAAFLWHMTLSKVEHAIGSLFNRMLLHRRSIHNRRPGTEEALTSFLLAMLKS